MKNILALLTFVFLSSCILFSQTNHNSTIEDYKKEIIGTWELEKDSRTKIIFSKNGKCYDYSDGKLDKTYYYSINTTSPQCSEKVPVGELYSYLKITNIKDPKDIYEYEINGLNKEILYLDYQRNLNTKLSKYTRQ
ncbi:hypothetical protein [uncultured Tenacibaculum sp.]|uniref:hypothetical protein n=1 Tax=uncultured Tenacibaculum sp. TaxID=174713 RepID=UPI00262A81DC|nr:hypothetical protein [uncultured Tenacibaculum sp.]